MDKKFSWYSNFPLEKNPTFWNSAVLSLDANVLLDLYRFHQTTRTKLLDAIKSFGDRIWLSDQASEEFIKNRKTVIVDVCNKFDQAKISLEKIQTEFKERDLRIIRFCVISRIQIRLMGVIGQPKAGIYRFSNGIS